MNSISLIQATLLFFSELQWPHELFLKYLLSPSRNVTCHTLQTRLLLSVSAYMEYKQDSLLRINMNMKGEER